MAKLGDIARFTVTGKDGQEEISNTDGREIIRARVRIAHQPPRIKYKYRRHYEQHTNKE